MQVKTMAEKNMHNLSVGFPAMIARYIAHM